MQSQAESISSSRRQGVPRLSPSGGGGRPFLKYNARGASLKDNSLTVIGIPSAGPGGNPFYNLAWLAREELILLEARPSTPESSSPIPNLICFPDLKDALKSHMHAKHRLSNAFWNMPCISTQMKRKIFQYRTGTLYNQKHAVRFKRSTSLVCPLQERHHMDSALHSLSGCQCPIVRNMVTERHNIASRLILKVVTEGSYGSNHIHMDVGSTDRLAQHDLQITEQVSNRVIPPRKALPL
eukprot:1153576-Pelagomonas_calceolata.AAC.1